MRQLFDLFDRIYKWEIASRRWVRLRMFLVAVSMAIVTVVALVLLSFVNNEPEWHGIRQAGFWLSMSPLLSWIIYSSIRTFRAAWKAIRGRPHELRNWREP